MPKKKENIIYTAIMTFVALILIIRCFFGFQQSDESLYLALVHRLYLGDKLLNDDWNPNQFYCAIYLPFYCLYRFFVKNGNGVILYFRLLASILSILTGFFTFRTFRKIKLNDFFCFAAAFTIMVFCKSNILGASYNNLCVCFTTLALLIMIGEEYSKSRLRQFFTGFLISLSVLCMPFLAIPVFLYSVFFLILAIIKKESSILFFIYGILATATVYVLTVFRLSDFNGIISGFECIFKDPEYKGGFFRFFKKTWSSFKNFNNKYVLAIIVTACILLLIYSMIKKGAASGLLHSTWLPILMIPAAILAYHKGFRNPGYPATLLCVWSMPAITLYFISDISNALKKRTALFLYFGFTMVLCYAGGSNTRLNGPTTGFTIIALGIFLAFGSIFSNDTESGTKKVQDIIRILLPIVCTSMIMILMLAQRILIVNRDADLNKLNCRIENGPAAGLFTTQEHRQQYNEVLKLIYELTENHEEKTVLYTKILPWAYICTNNKYGTPSAWRLKLSSSLLSTYYELYPDRIPDIVVILNEDIGSFERCSFSHKKGNATPNKNSFKGDFWDYLNSGEYEIIETDVATVYVK